MRASRMLIPRLHRNTYFISLSFRGSLKGGLFVTSSKLHGDKFCHHLHFPKKENISWLITIPFLAELWGAYSAHATSVTARLHQSIDEVQPKL
jgi:hypothetical protein